MIELKSDDGGKGWIDEEGTQEQRHGLDIWVTTTVELDDMDRADKCSTRIEGSGLRF